MLTNLQIEAKYGKPGDPKNLVSIELPFPYYLDWDPTQTINHIVIHRLVADRWLAAENEVLEHYGLQRIHELGIDQFAGCYNMRPKRGCETAYAAAISRGDFDKAAELLSTHSWAVAVDKDADRNKLNETAKTARFARPEYKDMIDIYYKHGFLSYGREKNYDYMHTETAI